MSAERDQSRASSLVGGAILILLGVFFLAERFGLADLGDVVHRYWPMIPALIGIPKLFSRETVWSGLWLIAIAAWLQITVLGLFGLGWATSWPLLLIVIGAGMTLRAVTDAIWPPDGENGETAS